MKKILSAILAALMSISCAAFVAADDAAVETSNSAETYAIEFLANYGIYKGASSAEFVADAASPIQRYQMALFVSRISTGWVDDERWEDDVANDSTFTDIGDEPASKYYGALSYANQKGIIEGYSATKFAPYDSITYRDALTMVVRTLGYTGLSYPWGYIQTAVELGLTENVDAAYTAELTRGQVAVILYNAMFAETKSGETLAKKCFDVDFAWSKIVITASDLDSFDLNGEKPLGKTEHGGYVGFKVLNADGTLAPKTYYVKDSEIGLDGHKDDLAIGHAYIALFKAKNGNFVELVDYDSLNYKTVWNNGLTDNEGVEVGTLPIAAELGRYAKTDKYYNDRMLNTITGGGYNEIIIFVADTIKYVNGYDSNKIVGIDAVTKNIVEVSIDENGDYRVDRVAWYYDSVLNRYYRYLVNNNSLFIDWMSDEEFTKWYNEYRQLISSTNGYVLSTTVDGKAPYAKLQMFDIDLVEEEDRAERALYKTYRLGNFYNTTLPCDGCQNAQKPAYTIKDLDDKTVLVNDFVEGACPTHAKSKIWVNVAEGVTGFVNENGSFNNGVILYNYNAKTGELEVVKYVMNNGMDKDSYFVTGTLTSYSTANAKVTIDGVSYNLGYPEMEAYGSLFGQVNKDLASRTRYAAELDEMYMQYVTATVLDNRIVDLDLVGNTDSNFIIVLGYAGLTSDNYWAVYGYSVADTSVKIYKINTFNGWKQGDYRYYPQNALKDGAFEAGTLYTIKSFDGATNSYNVYTQNKIDAEAGAKLTTVKFDRGYRLLNGAVQAQDAANKYILIYDDGKVATYTGIVNDYTWAIENVPAKTFDKTIVFFVHNDDLTDGTSKVVGFPNTDIGFVYYDEALSGRVLEAAFDSTIGDWYLLGGSLSAIRVVNLLTGNMETVLVDQYNVDLQSGNVYMTIGNTIIEDVPASEVEDTLMNIYGIYNVDVTSSTPYVMVELAEETKAEITSNMHLAKVFGLVEADADETNEITKKIADAWFTNANGNQYKTVIGYINGKVDMGYQMVDTTEEIINGVKTIFDWTYDVLVSYSPASHNVVIYVLSATKTPRPAVEG